MFKKQVILLCQIEVRWRLELLFFMQFQTETTSLVADGAISVLPQHHRPKSQIYKRSQLSVYFCNKLWNSWTFNSEK